MSLDMGKKQMVTWTWFILAFFESWNKIACQTNLI